MGVKQLMHGLIDGWLLAVTICTVLGAVFGLLLFVLLQPLEILPRALISLAGFLIVAPGIQYILKAPSEPTH